MTVRPGPRGPGSSQRARAAQNRCATGAGRVARCPGRRVVVCDWPAAQIRKAGGSALFRSPAAQRGGARNPAPGLRVMSRTSGASIFTAQSMPCGKVTPGTWAPSEEPLPALTGPVTRGDPPPANSTRTSCAAFHPEVKGGSAYNRYGSCRKMVCAIPPRTTAGDPMRFADNPHARFPAQSGHRACGICGPAAIAPGCRPECPVPAVLPSA